MVLDSRWQLRLAWQDLGEVGILTGTDGESGGRGDSGWVLYIVRIVGSLVGGYHLVDTLGAGGDARSRLKKTKTLVWSDYLTSSPKLRSRLFEILDTISTVITPPKVDNLTPIIKPMK